MSKAMLAALVSQAHDMTKAEAEEIVDTVFNGIRSALVSQGNFSYMGFGRWTVSARAARPGRNPKTGEVVQVDARMAVKFVAGTQLKNAINHKDD